VDEFSEFAADLATYSDNVVLLPTPVGNTLDLVLTRGVEMIELHVSPYTYARGTTARLLIAAVVSRGGQ